jgi:large subunit ribosomal protein L35
MPKLKTVKSAAKRVVGITKAGKVRVRRLSAQHLATNKSKRTVHQAAHTKLLAKGDAEKIKRMIPYA